MTFPETASLDGCHELATAYQVPLKTAEDWVPEGERYKLHSDDGENATFQINASRCDQVTVGDRVVPGPVRMGFGFFLIKAKDCEHAQEDPNNTDLEKCKPERDPNNTPADPTDDAIVGDAYLLFLSTDSKPFADWLRAGTDLNAYYVPLTYEYEIRRPFGQEPFLFKAEEPEEWAFTIDGTASAQQQEGTELFIDGNFWQDTKTTGGNNIWEVKLAAPYHAAYIAPANVKVTVGQGSNLGEILWDGDGDDDDGCAKVEGCEAPRDPFAFSALLDLEYEKTRTIIHP